MIFTPADFSVSHSDLQHGRDTKSISADQTTLSIKSDARLYRGHLVSLHPISALGLRRPTHCIEQNVHSAIYSYELLFCVITMGPGE